MKKARKSGLSLVEVLVATLLLAMTFAGVMSALTMTQKSVYITNDATSSIHQCRKVMEQLWAYDYYDPPLSVGTHTLSNGNYVVSLATNSYLTKHITVNVNFTEPMNSRTQTITMVSSFSQAIHR